MNYAKHLAVVPIVVYIFSLLPGCAAPPTKEELAALDYGACPQNYEAKIKKHFKGALLARYSDELLIWPPQKFWYKAPAIEGGQLYAGYLVPVMADQTFGPQTFAGKRLYGFLFKNDELVKTLKPVDMYALTIKEAVGPFPKDERDWKQGHSVKSETQMILEYVPPSETVHNWSELVTVQMFWNVSLDVSANKFIASAAEQHKSKEPKCAIVSQKILASSPTEVLYEQVLAKCAPIRDEYSIRKAIRGPRSLTEVSYSKTTEMDDTEKKKWAGIVGQSTMLNECQSKP